MTVPIVFLVDNGSLRPQATFALRRLAARLAVQVHLPIEAVSLLHSHKIPAEELGGEPATIVKRRMRECIEQGHRDFVCLPLFLGPSLAITEYLPQLIADLQRECADLRVRVAPVLAGFDWDTPDLRLARILAEQVRVFQPFAGTKVAMVDHGSPIVEVNRVRNAVARQLAQELALPPEGVLACSMERRSGEAYAFNEPLLETLAAREDFVGGDLLLALFFLLPGRHAGEGGDVAEICDGLVASGAFDRIQSTPLLGESPLLLDILEDRLSFVLR